MRSHCHQAGYGVGNRKYALHYSLLWQTTGISLNEFEVSVLGFLRIVSLRNGPNNLQCKFTQACFHDEFQDYQKKDEIRFNTKERNTITCTQQKISYIATIALRMHVTSQRTERPSRAHGGQPRFYNFCTNSLAHIYKRNLLLILAFKYI